MWGDIFVTFDLWHSKKTMCILNSCSTRICNAYKLWFSPKITLFWDFTQKLGATTTSITRASFSQWDILSFFERVTVPTAANIATNTFVLFQSEKKDIMTYARNIFAPLRLFKGKGSPSSADAQGRERIFLTGFAWKDDIKITYDMLRSTHNVKNDSVKIISLGRIGQVNGRDI